MLMGMTASARAQLLCCVTLLGCTSQLGDSTEVRDPEPPGEGVAYDAEHPGENLGLGKADFPSTYEIPTDLAGLERPEIIVSLEGLTAQVFDRSTGQSRVYPVGVGKRGWSGHSYTPAGFFATHSDIDSSWYFVERRYTPSYFGGFPFLRLDILNSKGQHTYGLHGPITYTCATGDCGWLDRDWYLVRDFVSHGCIRMQQDDIVELFWLVRNHPSTPVAIQTDVAHDAQGDAIDIGSEPVLWGVGDAIEYGECGARPDPYTVEGGWDSRDCQLTD
jgi:hypothetical protein